MLNHADSPDLDPLTGMPTDPAGWRMGLGWRRTGNIMDEGVALMSLRPP